MYVIPSIMKNWIAFYIFLEYMDLFTAGPNNLGRTEKLKHMIDTSRYQLIHLQAQWLSLVWWDEVMKVLYDMLKNDIIQPLKSPMA